MQNADFNFNNMADLPEEVLGPKTYDPGEAMEGEIVRIDNDGMVVSVGLKMEGMVPIDQMRSISPDELAALSPGDSMLVAMVGGGGPGGMALLSVDRARERLWWRELQDYLDRGEPLTARITGHNRGGVEVDYRGIRGFVPFSHLAPGDNSQNDSGAAERVGQECPFHVLEVDQDQERLVLTERIIWRQQQEDRRRQSLSQIEPGSTLKGKVVSVRGFGAFVDLGGIQGMVHISELSWGTVKDPQEVVNVGDEINVQVLAVNQENERISLSLKRTMPEPWETVPERYQISEIVQGTVTTLAQFGAFVKIEEGVEGLVHLSELSARRVEHAKECVYPGQSVRVMILEIDSARRRLSLSYKKAFGL
jgi:small subunit ribosomal protein S1